LSWHRDDSELYAGAFIYYAHPHWNAHWGGELLIADVPDDLDIMAYRFENEPYSEQLLEHGAGRFVMPKSNRLVILGGAPHAVAPVSAAAGQNVRASVSGFFLRESR
jgi:Rps23 Pro-64 3,4-dihydroxylase Tpa1-like proline 4-hydroxylase